MSLSLNVAPSISRSLAGGAYRAALFEWHRRLTRHRTQ